MSEIKKDNELSADEEKVIPETEEETAASEPENEIPETETKSSEKTAEKEGELSPILTRRAKHSILFIVMIILVAAGCVILNILSVALTERVPWLTTDITTNSSYDISEQSRQLAGGLNKKVKITFLTDKYNYEALDLYTKQASSVANQLSKYSNGMLTVEYLDLVKNPSITSKYPDEEIISTDVIVSCGDKYNILTKEDLFNFEYYTSDYSYISSSKAESAFDSSILTIVSDVSDKVIMFTDYENYQDSPDYLKAILKSNNYEIISVKLEDEEIPKNIKTAILFAPNHDYSEKAIEKLSAYLDNGGNYGRNLLYVSFKSKAELPNIDKLLDKYGMKIGHGLAFDMDETRLVSTSSAGYYVGILASFASELFTANIDQADLPVAVGYVRPVYSTNQSLSEPLLLLSEKSGFCDFDTDPEKWDMEAAIEGRLCPMAIGFNSNESGESRIIVSGSSTMFSQQYLQSQFSNQRYFLNLMATINDRDIQTVQLENKVVTSYDLTIDRSSAFTIGMFLFAVLPLCVLGAGFVVFLMRRKK